MLRTKLIATLGPACATEAAIRRLLEEGVSVCRLNFSHGTLDDHAAALANVRRAAEGLGRAVAVIGDLAGPKIRLGSVAEQAHGEGEGAEGGGMPLEPGDTLIIQREPIEGRDRRVSTNYSRFVDEVRIGDRVLIDDGLVRLLVIERATDHLACRCIAGGIIRTRKGINLPESDLTLDPITEHDARCVAWAAEHPVEYLALSFVRRAEDLDRLRERVNAAGIGAQLISKIEKPEALDRIDRIIAASDAVMVARGDLGVEMDLAQVPTIQKELVRRCSAAGRPVIVATQMLQSMIDQASPTRAEVSDVANAILDGADAVMLSGETAVGRDPALVVNTMARIARATEKYLLEQGLGDGGPGAEGPREEGPGDQGVRGRAVTERRLAEQGMGEGAAAGAGSLQGSVGGSAAPAPPLGRFSPDAAELVLARGAWQMARHLGVKLVAVWSPEGRIARTFAKMRPRVPVVALSADERVVRRMALDFGVHPHRMDVPQSIIEFTPLVERVLLADGWAKPGDTVLIVGGTVFGESGRSNAIMVHRVQGAG